MSSDIYSWCKDGQHCARGKASAQPAAPIQPLTVPERRFTHVHVDIGGPLPTSAEVSPHLVHISLEVHGHLHIYVGGQILSPDPHLIGLGTPIHLCYVDRTA